MDGIMDGIIEHNGGFYAQIRINHRDMPLGYWKTFAQAVKALWEREVFAGE